MEVIATATASTTFRQPAAVPAVAVVAGLPVALGYVGQNRLAGSVHVNPSPFTHADPANHRDASNDAT